MYVATTVVRKMITSCTEDTKGSCVKIRTATEAAVDVVVVVDDVVDDVVGP